MDNVTTEDNDKKIAKKTEALMNDAIKKLSGKTIVGNIVTSEDLEKLLHPGIEEQTRTMAFGHREHNLPKNNAMMQLAITKKILMMQKAIARAGLPVHLAHYSEQPMKKSVSTSIVEKPASEIESFEKARNKRMGNKNRRPQYRPWEPLEGAGSYMPDSVFQDWGEKVLPYWGFKPLQTDPNTGVPMKKDPSGKLVRDPGGPVKLEAKPGIAPIAARVARGALTTLVLGGLFGLDMVNHSLTGVFNSRGPDNRGLFSSANEHAASLFGSPFPFKEKSSLSTIMNNVRPDSPWQTMFANLNAAKPKISNSGKNIVWSEKAPTYQQMKYFNEKTSPYKAFDREKIDAYVEKMLNANRMYYGSLLGQNNTATGTSFHPNYVSHWDDLPKKLFQYRANNPGWDTNSALLWNAPANGIMLPRTSSSLEEQAKKEKIYLQQMQHHVANAAWGHWTKMIDPKNPVMPTVFSPRSQTYQPLSTNPLEWTHEDGTKVLSTALNSLGMIHPKQTGKSKIVPKITPSLIMSDPFWHHAYETEHDHGIDPIP